jgi:hypothetical protein
MALRPRRPIATPGLQSPLRRKPSCLPSRRSAGSGRGSRGTSAKLSVLSLFLSLSRTAKKRPCRNYRQNRLLPNRGGEIRTRDLLNPIRVAVRALTCIQLYSHAFRRFYFRTVALIPPHFVTATVTVRRAKTPGVPPPTACANCTRRRTPAAPGRPSQPAFHATR